MRAGGLASKLHRVRGSVAARLGFAEISEGVEDSTVSNDGLSIGAWQGKGRVNFSGF